MKAFFFSCSFHHDNIEEGNGGLLSEVICATVQWGHIWWASVLHCVLLLYLRAVLKMQHSYSPLPHLLDKCVGLTILPDKNSTHMHTHILQTYSDTFIAVTDVSDLGVCGLCPDNTQGSQQIFKPWRRPPPGSVHKLDLRICKFWI